MASFPNKSSNNKFFYTKLASILTEKYSKLINGKTAVFNEKGQNDQQPQKEQSTPVLEWLKQIDKVVQAHDGEVQAAIDLFDSLFKGALESQNWKNLVLAYLTENSYYKQLLDNAVSKELELEKKINDDPNLGADDKGMLIRTLNTELLRKNDKYKTETTKIFREHLKKYGLPPDETHPIVDLSNLVKAHYMSVPVAAALASFNPANLSGGIPVPVPPQVFGNFEEDRHFLPDLNSHLTKYAPVRLLLRTTDDPFKVFDWRTLGTHWVDAAIRLALGEPLPDYLREELNPQPPKPQNIK
jgi:hypothetical protein